MRIVTKYAMLALFSASFIALNNCGKRSTETADEAASIEHNAHAASEFGFGLPGPPLPPPLPFYPGLPWADIIVPVELNCNDGVDNDGDGFTDCEDAPDCHVHPECGEWGPPLEEVVNGRALTLYPNGLIVPEDYVILNTRGADDDDAHGWQRDNFFAAHQKDCWINPLLQDPYNFIPLGEPLITSPVGPVGPQLFPDQVLPVFGPRRGLIDECEFGTDLMFHHMDDDNGAGAGAAGDTDDDDGGDEDDQ